MLVCTPLYYPWLPAPFPLVIRSTHQSYSVSNYFGQAVIGVHNVVMRIEEEIKPVGEDDIGGEH